MDNATILSEDFLNITEENKPGKRLLKTPEASKKEQIADAKFEKKLKKLNKKKIGFTNTLAIYLVLLVMVLLPVLGLVALDLKDLLIIRILVLKCVKRAVLSRVVVVLLL